MFMIKLYGCSACGVPDGIDQVCNKLRKHLRHHARGEYNTIIAVETPCEEIEHQRHVPVMQVYVTADENVDALLGAIDSCPHVDIERMFDLQVIRIEFFRPRKR